MLQRNYISFLLNHILEKNFDFYTESKNQEQKKRILRQITAAETMERYLHTKYVGQKRFSLEGGETFIAALDYLIQNASVQGVEEVITTHSTGVIASGWKREAYTVNGTTYEYCFATFDKVAGGNMSSSDVEAVKGALTVTIEEV